jgi:hypothetical protein
MISVIKRKLAMGMAFTAVASAAVIGIGGVGTASAALDECSDLGYTGVGLIYSWQQGNTGGAQIINCGSRWMYSIDVKSGPDPACVWLNYGEKIHFVWSDGTYRAIKTCYI